MCQCVAATNSSALAVAPIRNGDSNIMTYGDRLKRWVVVLLLPKMQRVDLARFYKATDAEGYAQVLRQMNPGAKYVVMFDSEVDKLQP